MTNISGGAIEAPPLFILLCKTRIQPNA